MIETTEANDRDRLDRIIFDLESLLNAERASLFRVDEDRRQLRIAVAHPEGGLDLEVHMPLNHGIVGRALATGQPVFVENAYADGSFCPYVDWTTGFHTRSLLAVPIHAPDGRVVAVMEALNRRDGFGFDGEDVALVRAHESELHDLLEAGA